MFDFIKGLFKRKDKGGDMTKDTKYLEFLINQFLSSRVRMDMLTGERYYRGYHDILYTKRQAIGKGGRLVDVDNLPNNKIIDNQYERLVDQKINYLLSKPITFKTENKEYSKLLEQVFDKRFLVTMKNLGEDCLNNGIGWLYPYYNSLGEFVFKKFEPSEIIPVWKDQEHTELDFVIRIYELQEWTGSLLETVEKVEVYKTSGIDRYGYRWGALKYEGHTNYISLGEQEYNWQKIPLIPFKYNQIEKPLINRVKNLQDAINKILSMFQNNMEEDPRSTILIITNYEGQDLGEFRENLSRVGAVNVGKDGKLEKLTIEVNHENYKFILDELKDALIENGRGFDAKDERMGANPNQMNIQSMYSDIDLDANGMETEFQASFDKVLWFVDNHLSHKGFGDFENEKAQIIFNKDILINETDAINNCAKSEGIISKKTIVSQHPWVTDVEAELAEMKKEDELEPYGNLGPGDSNEE